MSRLSQSTLVSRAQAKVEADSGLRLAPWFARELQLQLRHSSTSSSSPPPSKPYNAPKPWKQVARTPPPSPSNPSSDPLSANLTPSQSLALHNARLRSVFAMSEQSLFRSIGGLVPMDGSVKSPELDAFLSGLPHRRMDGRSVWNAWTMPPRTMDADLRVDQRPQVDSGWRIVRPIGVSTSKWGRDHETGGGGKNQLMSGLRLSFQAVIGGTFVLYGVAAFLTEEVDLLGLVPGTVSPTNLPRSVVATGHSFRSSLCRS